MVKELLRKLSNAHGVSGSEGSIGAVIKKELKGHVDEMHEDPLGNLIAVKKGEKFKVMLAAHMDEIGLIVKHVDERGFIRFAAMGGFYAPTLLQPAGCPPCASPAPCMGSSAENPRT